MTMFPKFSKKREGENVVMEQKLLQNVNNLILNAETCTGCGICVEACPEDAIVLGLVGAARRGAINYAAPIDVDEVKCSYCGVCVCMCPFNALTLKVDGEERLVIVEKEGFPQYDRTMAIDQEKCIKCTICEDVCPRDAIDRNVPEFEGTEEDGAKRQSALESKTTFKVDDEKCTLCGICGELCQAIDVKLKPFSADSGKVEGEVLWDESKCDGCKVCVDMCPPEAITVERTVSANKMKGEVQIVDEDCCTCTWCSTNCPTEAITIDKLIEGEIEFHSEKCPGGCSTCVEICPANAIYLPAAKPASEMAGAVEPTIAVNKDLCIMCGACVNACPGEDIIVLQRTGLKMKGKETDLFKRVRDKLFTKRTSKVKEDKQGEVGLKMLGNA